MSVLSLFSPFFLWLLGIRQLAGLLLAIAAMYLCRQEEKEKAAGPKNGLRRIVDAAGKKRNSV